MSKTNCVALLWSFLPYWTPCKIKDLDPGDCSGKQNPPFPKNGYALDCTLPNSVHWRALTWTVFQ